jgi:hypothetical protein
MLEINGEQKINTLRRRAHKPKMGANEVLVYTATSLPLSAREEIESIVADHDSKLAEVVRQLVLRGLAAYHRDGLLQEPAEILPYV